MYDILKNKTIAITSLWGYPFGGGEEYLYQTAIWNKKYNITTYWLCFSNANNKPYDKLNIISIDGFKIIQIPDGLNKKNLYNWLKILKPDLVHHQGHYRKDFYEVCSMLRIEFLTGAHFWSGIVDLDPEYGNIDIYENASKHKANPDFIELYDSPFCSFYSVSKFVSECVLKITNKTIQHMCYSGSQKIKNLVDNNNPIENQYVTIINIHKLKGGELLLYLLNELRDIPFMVIRTEYMSEELDKKIEAIINERNCDGVSAQCLFLERINDMKFVYGNTKIFLASSLCDETFHRTCNEAMMNGIPVIATGQGNIKYLVENGGIIMPLKNKNDMIQWKNCIRELWDNDNKFNEIAKSTKNKYEEYSEEVCEKLYIDCLKKVFYRGKSNNIMILAPWCDQGLGIQSRNYYKLLSLAGYNVHIFSLKPYNGNSAIELQKNPSEWQVNSIYYSGNDREHVTDIELLSFIKEKNIGKALFPEPCFAHSFHMTKLLRDQNVLVYAIPNSEIVKKSEATKHKYFHKILCNNLICKKIFDDSGIYNNEYIGYGIIDENIKFKQKNYDGIVKFFVPGGMNGFSRKHVLEICEAFAMAYEKNQNIYLTCTIQKTNLLEVEKKEKINQYIGHPGINIIQKHLSYAEIISLYQSHHICMQLSTQEGLGLAFYESVATGTPVLTLKNQPHCEIILDKINGWVIDCYFTDMTDNVEGFVKASHFEIKTLCNKILEIAENPEELKKITKTLMMDYNKRLSGKIFIKKFIEALY